MMSITLWHYYLDDDKDMYTQFTVSISFLDFSCSCSQVQADEWLLAFLSAGNSDSGAQFSARPQSGGHPADH